MKYGLLTRFFEKCSFSKISQLLKSRDLISYEAEHLDDTSGLIVDDRDLPGGALTGPHLARGLPSALKLH